MQRRLSHFAGLTGPLALLAALLALTCAATPARAALLVEISNLSDVNFGTWNMGDPDLTANVDICVYSTLALPSGGYAIKADATGGFVLSYGPQTVPYSLTWNDGGAGSLGNTGTALVNSTKLTDRNNANILLPACLLGSPTARLIIKIAQADLTTISSGTYTGTLNLTVSPN